MIKKMTSQNTELKIHIRKKVEGKYNYTLKQNKKRDIDEFCKIHNLDPKKVRYAHRLMLKQVLEEYGIDPISVGYGKNKRLAHWKKFNQKFNPPEIEKPTIQTEASGQNLILENPPTTEEQKQEYEEIETKVEEIKKVYVFTEETLKQFWVGIWFIFKLKWKYLDGLTEQEKADLSKMWRPFFQKYIPESVVLILVPSIITIGIFGKKIIQAREIRKEKQLEEKSDEKENKNQKSLLGPENLESKSQKKPDNKKSDKFSSKSGRVWNDETQIWEEK